MSDDEIDREWKGNRRPQSTMARSFSLALNDLFKIDGSVADLDAAVEQKKQAVSSQTSELEALEERLRATEERLKKAAGSASGGSSPRQRMALGGDTFSAPKDNPTSPLATEVKTSRPSTARPKTKDGGPGSKQTYQTPPMPGALPPTPGASEGESDFEYILVDEKADSGKDGDNPQQGN